MCGEGELWNSHLLSQWFHQIALKVENKRVMAPDSSRGDTMNPSIQKYSKMIQDFKGRPWELRAKAPAFGCCYQRRISNTDESLLWGKTVQHTSRHTHTERSTKQHIFGKQTIFLHLPLYSWMKIFLPLLPQQELQIQTGCFQPQIFHPMEEKSSAFSFYSFTKCSNTPPGNILSSTGSNKIKWRKLTS